MEPLLTQPELQLRFPIAVEASASANAAKVVQALWQSGEQCYCNLRLLTGLSRSDLNAVLRDLLEIGWIEKHEAAVPPGLDANEDMNRFVLTSEIIQGL